MHRSLMCYAVYYSGLFSEEQVVREPYCSVSINVGLGTGRVFRTKVVGQNKEISEADLTNTVQVAR